VAPSKVYAVVERLPEDGAGTVREVRAVCWGLLPAWWKPGIDPKTGKQDTPPSLPAPTAGYRAVVAGAAAGAGRAGQ
jgi:hypothetical protein